MKRIFLTLATLVCLVMGAWAQQLSVEQWNHGLAVAAHYTAYAQRFGKRMEEIKEKCPANYKLDDLNTVYSDNGARWDKIYNEFKPKENQAGTLEDLQNLIKDQRVWRNMVEPDMQEYLKANPASAEALQAAADSRPAPDQQVQGEGGPHDPQMGQAPGNPGGPNPMDQRGREQMRHGHKDQPGGCHGFNWPLCLGILGTLLGLAALITALMNRCKINKLRRVLSRELERTNGNLQQLANDSADQMKALSIRLTGREARRETQTDTARPAQFKGGDSKKEEKKHDQQRRDNNNPKRDDKQQQQQPRQQQQQQPRQPQQPRTIYLSKPDENDNFVRASDKLEPGNSIYVLKTNDGKHGTFEVIKNADVHRFALMMPAENLIRACSGNAIQIPKGTKIVTDRPGEAVYENGKWHVTLKAIIHYED